MTYRVFVGWRGVARWLARARDGSYEGAEEEKAMRFPIAQAQRLARQFNGQVVI